MKINKGNLRNEKLFQYENICNVIYDINRLKWRMENMINSTNGEKKLSVKL